ncbi:hypothetical protein, partial [Cupriavidus necator]|uniref:hypothetical protein n=1 Tax=Cupriavidus necator TaxID=106590 RepID=UPI0030F426AE
SPATPAKQPTPAKHDNRPHSDHLAFQDSAISDSPELPQASPASSECDISYRLHDSGRKYWLRHRITGDRAWKPEGRKQVQALRVQPQYLCSHEHVWFYGGPSEAAARLAGFLPVSTGFPPSLSGPPPSPANEWRALTW